MKKALLFLLGFLFMTAGLAAQQIDPQDQIRWPANCNQPGMVYNLSLNLCIPAGSGSGGGGSASYPGVVSDSNGGLLIGTAPINVADGCPMLSGANQLCVKATGYNASGSSVTTTVGTGGFAAGASGSVASCTSFAVNQGVYIAGAGAGGANYIGTVTSCSGTVLSVTPATSTAVTSGAVVQHDDTNAFQTAINTLATSGGKIVVPDGVYRLNGPLQDTGGANAVLILPAIPIPDSHVSSNAVGVSIAIEGVTPPITGSYEAAPTQGAILRSSQTSGAIIGGYSATSFYGHVTFVLLTLRNLTFRTFPNPTITAVNAYNMANLMADHLQFDVGVNGTPTQPLNANGVALKMPNAMNWTTTEVHDTQVVGYYAGFEPYDHSYLNTIACFFCQNGVIPNATGNATPYTSYREVIIDQFLCQDCTNALTGGAAAQNVLVNDLSHEAVFYTSPPTGWTKPVAIVNDPSNYLVGQVNFSVVGGLSRLVATGAVQAIGGQNMNMSYISSLPHQLHLMGTTSGSASIGTAAAAGSPSTLLLPTGDGAEGQVLAVHAAGGGTAQAYWSAGGGGPSLATASVPAFSPPPGVVTSGTTVSITCAHGAPFYTLNNTDVISYTTPISITASQTINGGCGGPLYVAQTASALYTLTATLGRTTGCDVLNSASVASVNCTVSGLVGGETILIHTYRHGNPSLVSVTDSGGSGSGQPTLYDTHTYNSTGLDRYVVVNANAGAHTITMTVSAATAYQGLFVDVIANANTSTPIAINGGFASTPIAGCNGTITSAAVNGVSVGQLIFFFAQTSGPGPLTAGSGYTLYPTSSVANIAREGQLAASAGSYTASVGGGGTNQSCSALTLVIQQ